MRSTHAALFACLHGGDNETVTRTVYYYFIATPPDRGCQRNEGLLLLHSFLSLDILVAFVQQTAPRASSLPPGHLLRGVSLRSNRGGLRARGRILRQEKLSCSTEVLQRNYLFFVLLIQCIHPELAWTYSWNKRAATCPASTAQMRQANTRFYFWQPAIRRRNSYHPRER